MDREEAIQHVVDSTNYWAGDNLHSDASFNCPSNLGAELAFEQAVEHVRYYHYNLTKSDVEEARKRVWLTN